MAGPPVPQERGRWPGADANLHSQLGLPQGQCPPHPTSIANVKHTHPQTLGVEGRGQKLINQILLSAVKLLFLPACFLHKTALKQTHIQTLSHWPETGSGLGALHVCAWAARACTCRGTELAEGLDGWQRERTTSTQKPGGQASAPSPSLSSSFLSHHTLPLLPFSDSAVSRNFPPQESLVK